MQNFALLGFILLAMVILPVAIVGALGLALRGVSSLDLSVFDFYIVIATPHILAVPTVAEVMIVLAAYLMGYTQAGEWLQ